MEEDILHRAELKSTRQRRTILQVLEHAGRPMTAEEIHEAVSQDYRVNLSTIYRTLGVLTEKGVLIKMQGIDDKASYQLGSRHKHQLVCARCHQVVLIDACPLEQLGRQLSEETGYVITGHSLEFVGLCPKCARQQEEKARGAGKTLDKDGKETL